VPGPSLEAALRQGPLAADRVLEYALQIAGALEAAHRKGVVHRDLKPGNVVIGESGVKILDFGLAKMERGEPVTRDGAIVGTPNYMSPEQVRGEEVDARSDIFSFGVVLREMLTGQATALGQVADRCLRERREERWQSAGELRSALETVGRPAVRDRLRWGRRGWIGMAAGSAAAAVLAWKGAEELTPRLTRSELRFAGGEMIRLSLSPDGRRLAFVANGKLFVRTVTGSEIRVLELAAGVGSAFWSPDGKRLAVAAGGALRVLDLASGGSTTLAKVNTNISGSWGADGSILIGLVDDGIYRIPATGGSLTRVTAIDPARGEARHMLPHFLPDGRHFLFVAGAKSPGASVVCACALDSAKRRPIQPVDSGSVFVAKERGGQQGYLVFGRQGSVVAQPFDAERLGVTGEEFVVAERVVTRAAIGSAAQLMEFSVAGRTLAFRAMGNDSTIVIRNWMERRG
jgi:eukaryotic-like serine/threonine-protein kinase